MISLITTLATSVLAKLPGIIGDYFKRKQEIQKIEAETRREIALETKKLAQIVAKSNAERSMAVLKTSTNIFKQVLLSLWLGPLLIVILFPSWGVQIFANMALAPPWYIESALILVFNLWGILVAAPTVANVFIGLKQFFREKRIMKVATSPNVDNEALFAVIRSMMPNNKLTQDQVDKINDII